MNKISFLIAPLASLLAMTGCAVETGPDATGESQQDLVGWNQCSAASHNGWPLNAVVELDRASPHYIYITFHGVPYTIANNAHVRLVHPDGSWVQFETSDNIVNGVRTHAYLNWSHASGSIVSAAVGPGDVYRISPVFDLPNSPDRACATYLAW